MAPPACHLGINCSAVNALPHYSVEYCGLWILKVKILARNELERTTILVVCLCVFLFSYFQNSFKSYVKP